MNPITVAVYDTCPTQTFSEWPESCERLCLANTIQLVNAIIRKVCLPAYFP